MACSKNWQLSGVPTMQIEMPEQLMSWVREPTSALPFLLIFLYWGTVLLGPLVIVRYMYPLMIIAPVALALALRAPVMGKKRAPGQDAA